MTIAPLSLLPSEEPVQLIDAAGVTQESEGYSLPETEELRRVYAALVAGRRINEQCNALVRQGRLAVYPASQGQEACQVAAALVLDDDDWLFPTYRDSVAGITRGIDPGEAMVLLRGDWHSGYDPKKYRVAPQATPLATQLLHAVGVAHAAMLRGERTVVLALCGDGATSEGDFHEALNFAAVFGVPVVFFVQNNEFAISVPLSRQSAAPSLAHKAIGYGMPGHRVDGNDAAAVMAVLRGAIEHAREGNGPSLVEAHTYRMQAHTNADDDTRYRERVAVESWIERDPLTRLRTHLVSLDALSEADEAEFAEAAETIATDLRRVMNEEPELDPEKLFQHVYATRTPQLQEQWEMLQDEINRAEGAEK